MLPNWHWTAVEYRDTERTAGAARSSRISRGMVRAISAMYCIRSPPLKTATMTRASHRRSWQHR